MADSVGKISLDIDIQSGLAKEIRAAGDMIGARLTKQLQSTLNSTTGLDADKLTKPMGDAFKKTMEDAMKPMTNLVDSALGIVQEKVEKSIKETNELVKKSIEGNKVDAINAIDEVSGRMKKVKPLSLFGRLMPARKASVVDTEPASGTESLIPSRKKSTKANVPEMNVEDIKAQIASLEPVLNNVNGRLEFQHNKLKELNEAYNSTFNDKRKNKLQGQILNTEATILRLTKTSDSTAQKIFKLEDALKQAGNGANKADNDIERLDDQLKKTNKTMARTQKESQKTGGAFSFLGRKAADFGRIIKQAIVFTLVYKSLSALGGYLGSALKTNEQFMHSLGQVRTNLQVAFMPVYQAILPALQVFMSALARVTTYIATFMSALFGKTYRDSFKAAQGLNAARIAMENHGKASKKTAKAVREANLAIAGFDEINTLNHGTGAPDVDGGGGGVVSDIAPLVQPDMDTSIIDSKMAKFVSKLKSFFEPVTTSFGKLWETLKTFSKTVGEGLKWFWDNVLVPLGSWVVNEYVPRFLERIAIILEILGGVIDLLKKPVGWLFENLLKPIAEWSASYFLEQMDLVNGVLSSIRDWVKDPAKAWSEFKTHLVEVATELVVQVTTILTTFKIGIETIFNNLGTSLIMAVTSFYTEIKSIWTSIGTWLINKVSSIRTSVVNFFENMRTKLLNTVLLIKNGITGSFTSLGTAITSRVSSIRSTAVSTFENLWSRLSSVTNTIKNGVTSRFTSIKNGITNAFKGIPDWFKNTFTKAWTNVKNVFSSGGKIFTGIKDGIASTFKTIVNGLISGINRVLSVPFNSINRMLNSIRDTSFMGIAPFKNLWGKNPLYVPQIPKLARGGIIDQPTLAMVGEAGKEAVMPLENNTGWINNLAGQIAGQMGGQSSSSDESVAILRQIVDVLMKILNALLNNDTEAIFKVGETEFGRAAISAINRVQRQAGKTLLNV